ncbi:MAG: hypothetical protein M3081_21600 [Gemmatimonadota bacterium]|nr:hypothetical protein [Gemmatimonadota bacterium]
MINRRDLLRSAIGGAIAASAPRALLALDGLAKSERTDRPHLTNAIRAANWIKRSRMVTEHGVAWPADPLDPKSVSTTLYSGTPGVVLFLLEMHAATGTREYLDDACAGADYIAATMPADDAPGECGLYEGTAGHAFVLEQVWRASGRATYHEAARRAVARIYRRAESKDGGVQWSDSTDIISGASGTGLFLLAWAAANQDADSRALAIKAGRRMLDLAQPAPSGLMWRMDPSFVRIMPNFSHGTAGVSYFLATLNRHTGEAAFRNAAVAGAKHLQAIAKTDDDACVIYHHNGDGEHLFYLGWCHGPVGTARLFQQLAVVTKDAAWSGWVRRSARGISARGIPEKRTPGFRNNMSQCCGDAGVSQFFLDLHHTYGDPADLAYARRVAADVMLRSTAEGDGLKWVQAENRTQPENLVAQTGFMQGAAGAGMLFLRLDGVDAKRAPRVLFPDTPFGV